MNLKDRMEMADHGANGYTVDKDKSTFEKIVFKEEALKGGE